jgi:arylsulfatase A-like enzyme
MKNNYLLITIDALRPDHLNIYGYNKRVTSPAIDQFAERSNVYLNAYACGVPTFLSLPSIFCSVYSSKVMHNMYLPQNIPTLAELLKSQGFRTAAFIDNNPWASSLLGYDRGFDLVKDYFVESLRTKKRNKKIKKNLRFIPKMIYILRYLISTGSIQPKTNTEQIIQDTLKFMKSPGVNFFAWLHLMDIHWPFSFLKRSNPLAKYEILKVRRLFSPIPGERDYDEKTGQLFEEMYDMSIRRLDAKLEILFDSLQREGILENTWVFITSDHGEEFLERGSLAHHENVYKEVTRVPLIIKKPDSEEYSKSESMVSLLDIPTTILKNESIPIPGGYEGGAIFENERTYCISETVVPTVNKLAKGWENLFEVPLNQFIYAVRDKEYTVVYDKDGKYKFFDRKTDAQEKIQIESSNVELERLVGALERHRVISVDSERSKVRQRITQLKALGKIK